MLCLLDDGFYFSDVTSSDTGKDSDHEVIVYAPLSDNDYLKPRTKKTITIRPLPQSGIDKFGKEITGHDWREVLEVSEIDLKVNNFHSTLRGKLNRIFPEKIIKISSLDKKWMNH